MQQNDSDSNKQETGLSQPIKYSAHNHHPPSFAIYLWPYFSNIYAFLEIGGLIELKRTVKPRRKAVAEMGCWNQEDSLFLVKPGAPLQMPRRLHQIGLLDVLPDQNLVAKNLIWLLNVRYTCLFFPKGPLQVIKSFFLRSCSSRY